MTSNRKDIFQMKKLWLILFVISLVISCKHKEKSEEVAWRSLWNNKDFEGWHSYLGTPYNLTVDSIGNPINAYGIDHDPIEVFSIVEIDQSPAIRISGVAWGMIYTEEEFANYHMKLKVKWGEDMHPPREKGPRDSGLLYHGFGEPGSAYFWMNSQELQIQQGDMGDYWPVGDVEIDIPSIPLDERFYIYKDDAPLRTYYFADLTEENLMDSLAKRRVYKSLDAENEHGKWNDVELICWGDSVIHIVNNKVVMRLYNSRTMDQKNKLSSGKIILQSEGAEVFYKDLFVRPINSIPSQFVED